ncbi:MAG: hypothetical protein M3Y17_04120 [Actinomycetota bacterium]|nr:hypothetical protein [Actinomycetota bacterium]
MSVPGTLERIIDASGVSARIEALLPIGVRPRQLSVRTLLAGMLLTAVNNRPAHLRRVHQALTALPAQDKQRLGITAEWKHGPHLLTYRQVERTFALVVKALAKDEPDGSPSDVLSEVLDALLESSIQALGEPASSSYAVDWTDQETWSRPPPKQREQAEHPGQSEHASASADTETQTPSKEQRSYADPEASWGHRRGNHPGQKDEAFYGYYLQAATIVKDEHGPNVPELVRRIHIASCDHDPPAQLVPVLQRMAASNITIADVLADSGYAYRVAERWALPVRQLGASLIQDLHPNDQGVHGTHKGAICANGNLYCPATPKPLFELSPLARGASADQIQTHDQHSDELSRYKLSPITSYDPDGYRRVACPAAQGKLRCPLRPATMTLAHARPQVLQAPEHPPTCCSQQTITVPASVNAKTAQKHDYPSAAHRRSYARRSGAERAFSTVKDPATNNLNKGWCRLTGLTPIALLTATVFIARNLRIADAFAARQAENQRRAANGIAPKQRKRRRRSTDDLITTANAPP